MINKLTKIFLAIVATFALSMSCIIVPVYADTVNCNILLSNIAGGNPSGLSVPGEQSVFSITGKTMDGQSLIAINDLAKLGCTVSINPYNSNEWIITINGQTIKFTNGSGNYTASYAYSIQNPGGGSNTYNYSFSGTANITARVINGIKYVRLPDAVKQIGSLMVRYDANNNCVVVHHFRASGQTTPHADPNTYIVGGPWLNNWDSYRNAQLSQHFQNYEMRSRQTASQDPDYYSQLKISVKELQVAENVRYHYNNNSSMTITNGFRSWLYNAEVSTVARSFHSRGRAWDASNTNSIYTKVYNEFKGSYSTPDTSITNLYRTRVSGTSADKSGGYEIERMPQSSGTWLHMQTQPQEGSAM